MTIVDIVLELHPIPAVEKFSVSWEKQTNY